MTRSISARDAGSRFAEVLDCVVTDGETLVVERDGTALAVVMPAAEYEGLRHEGEDRGDWEQLLDDAIRAVDEDVAGGRVPSPDEVIRSGREERDARLARVR